MTQSNSSSTTRLHKYRQFLSTLQINPNLRNNHTVEFDLRGTLNPSTMLSKLFEKNQGMLSFNAFADLYWEKHHVALRAEHSRLAQILSLQGPCKLKEALGDYAGRFSEDFRSEMSDNELKEGIIARLYRTQFGIYTEYDAYLSCVTVLGEDQVKRSDDLDRHGVDFVLIIQGTQMNIHVFQDSTQGRRAKINKIRNKHGFSRPGTHVLFPYGIHRLSGITTRDLGNGFYVYQDEYVNLLIDFLRKIPKDTEVVDFENNEFVIKKKNEY